MATKPATTFVFATDANYTTGARIGSATKVDPSAVGTEGLVPGVSMIPETINYAVHWTGEWLTDWVSQGASALQEDAHIVETDSTGATNLRFLSMAAITPATIGPLLLVDGANVIGPALVQLNSSGGPGSALAATGTSGDGAIRASNNAAGAGLRAINSGTGPAITAEIAAGNGNGITSDSLGGYGVDSTTQGAGFAGVRGTGANAAGGVGVLGRSGHFGSNGVAGENLNGTADPTNRTHAGVQGRGLDASAVWGQSTNGYGVVAESDTTSPARASFRQVPQDSEPGSALHGDYYANSVKSTNELFQDSNWKVIHASLRGFNHGQSTLNSATGFNSGAFVTVGVVNITAPDNFKELGIVNLEVTCNIRNGSATLESVEFEIRDTTAATVIATREFYLTQTKAVLTAAPNTNAFERSITIRVPYNLPATGARSFDVRLRNNPAGGAAVDYADLMLTVNGVY